MAGGQTHGPRPEARHVQRHRVVEVDKTLVSHNVSHRRGFAPPGDKGFLPGQKRLQFTQVAVKLGATDTPVPILMVEVLAAAKAAVA